MKRKMKKTVIGILMAMMVLFIGTATVSAAGPRHGRNFVGTVNNGISNFVKGARSYIDSNNDGICDNYGSNFTDTNNDGVCDNYGTRQGKGFRGGRNR